AMNGSINFSIPDGWIPEFAKDGENSFIIPPADRSLRVHEQDEIECQSLLNILENDILPTYYDKPKKWAQIMMNGMRDVSPEFDSDRMAAEYYTAMFNKEVLLAEPV
ncbi:MAG: hypothetical protein WAT22_12320, partial [Saprospiraceae bacterium]